MLSTASAETWSDVSGNYRIEAEYVRVDGKSVVLRKADGSSVSVPINRLSEQSREQAKRRFEQAKSIHPDAASNSLAGSNYQLDNHLANIIAPTPPDIGPLAPFPNNPTLQQQFDYVRDQAMNGHLEVFWHCLPGDLRAELDSQPARDAIYPSIQHYNEQNAPFEKLTAKLLEVLTTKKEFILGSSMLASLPPNARPMLEQGYDPTVGLLYEWVSLSNGMHSLHETTFTQWINYHLPRLGAHAKELLPLLPPSLNMALSQIAIEQTDASSGTITIPKQDGGTETIAMTRHHGRWLPASFVETLAEHENGLIEQIQASVSELQSTVDNANQNPSAVMVKNLAEPFSKALDGLIESKTQQEFDQATMAIMQQAMSVAAGGMKTLGDSSAGPAPGF
ncbi:hypothetical protein RSSM_02166 [Rhodopirellula sallentina SM41]|uniref:SLA1 homology domain-containing protein n=1 Tax=Rhodopirellula sallentina SM41 TaxID=1263870 RepID=M5UEV0_9BACT|nr:hypothetical protein RSSM_02166 [Rhodopirellula sallentina SM41]